MEEKRESYFLSYNQDTERVEVYGKPMGTIDSSKVKSLWLTIMDMDNRLDVDGKPLVHGSLWQRAIVKVKDTKRCPVCGHVHDYHPTSELTDGYTVGYCLHCSTSLFRDNENNLYTTLGRKSGYYILVDRIAGNARPWKACHRHYAK